MATGGGAAVKTGDDASATGENPGRETQGAGEQGDRQAAVAGNAAEGGEDAPGAEELFIPVELLTALPPEPRRPADFRIGEIPTVDSLGAQAAFALEATESYVAALLAGNADEESYYDPYTEAEVEGRLRANCDSLRLGIPERLSQGEWAVPYRCLQNGDPTSLGGLFYLSVNDDARVVDAVAEPFAGQNLEATPSQDTEEPPF